MVGAVDRTLLEQGRCTHGDTIVVVAGRPHGVSGTTNALQVHRVGGLAD